MKLNYFAPEIAVAGDQGPWFQLPLEDLPQDRTILDLVHVALLWVKHSDFDAKLLQI